MQFHLLQHYDWEAGDQVNIIETFGHLFIWLFWKVYFDPSDYLLITKERKISPLYAEGQHTCSEMSKLLKKQNRKQIVRRTRTWTLRIDSNFAEYVTCNNWFTRMFQCNLPLLHFQSGTSLPSWTESDEPGNQHLVTSSKIALQNLQ